MAEWTVSQWFIIPLIVAAGVVETVGILGLFLYPLVAFMRGLRTPVQELKANTPGLPGDPRNRVS